MRENGVPIVIPRGMDDIELEKAIIYGAHTLALKEKSSIREKLVNELRVGHISVFNIKRSCTSRVHEFPPYQKFCKGVGRQDSTIIFHGAT